MKFFKTPSVFVLQWVFLLFGFGGYAQNPSQIDVLTTEDGLLFRDVANIAQDHKGLMWFGTNQGLNRYDGHNFKAYTNDPKNPFFIEEDFIKSNTLYNTADNALWFLANDELFKLELSSDSIFPFDKHHNLKGQVLDVFKAPDDAIWVVTDDFWQIDTGHAKQYLQKFVNGKFKVMVALNRFKRGFSNLTSDTDGYMWWATTSGTYKYTVEGKLIKTLNLDTYNWNGDTIHFVPQFFARNNTHYYFPPSRGGVEIYNGAATSSTRVFDVKHIIRRAIEDRENNIWFAGDDTLFRMDSNGNFRDYTALLKSKLDYTTINNLYIDQTGLLWVATNNGLFKIRTEKNLFTTVFKSEKYGWGNSMRGIFESADGRIFSLCESKHQLWYKTNNGQIDSLPLKTTSGKPLSLMYDASFMVTNNQKTHAYAIGNGICEIDLNTGQTKIYNQFRSNNKIYGPNALLMLNDEQLLFGYTLELLTVFNPKTEESRLVFKNLTAQSNITDLQYFEQSKDTNCVWVGTKNDGVLKINLNGSIVKSYNSGTLPELGKHHILCLEEDADGSLWVGSYGGGLSHIATNGKTLTNYKKANGLPNNNVVGILPDGNNKLWVSTYNGLALFNKTTKEFQNFYTEDGLSHNEFNYASFFKDSKGTYYFGGMNGINQFNSNALLKQSEPPKLQLLSVLGYNSKDKTSFETDYSQNQFTTLNVSPYDQYFEISWTMPSYFQNNKNTYSTKLEGLDDRWFYQGAIASIRYNQLPAGDYVLMVKGKDSRGNESASVLSVPIKVNQIFYKKWWFILLVMLAIVGVMYAIFKYRFQQALAMERLRTKISSDLHDDVGSLLSGLAMQTELMELNATAADKSKLQKIAAISRNAISQMRDLVWSIDSRRETTTDLVERMQELAEELLLPKGIMLAMDCNSIKYPNRKLSAQIKRNTFLIYKEAITNILRHSDAKQVEIIIKNHNKGCEFIIKDDGSKKACYKSTGLGLANMKLRAQEIKADVTFKTDEGFSVILHLPFHL